MPAVWLADDGYVDSWATHPRFLFGLAEKKTGRARSKRTLWQQLCTNVQRCCTEVDVRWRLRVCDDRTTGATGCGADFVADSRGVVRLRSGRKGAFDQFLFPRVPQLPGQRQRKEKLDVSQTSPGWRFPQGPGVSVPDFYEGRPTVPCRRQEVCACADRPADALFLFHRARRILFLAQPKREWGAHPAWTMPPAGADTPEAAGRRPHTSARSRQDTIKELF